MVIIIEFDFGHGFVNRYGVKDWARALRLLAGFESEHVKHVRVWHTLTEF